MIFWALAARSARCLSFDMRVIIANGNGFATRIARVDRFENDDHCLQERGAGE